MTPADAMRGVSLDRGSRAEKTFAQRMFEWAEPEAAATLNDAQQAARHRRRREAAERAIASAVRSIANLPDLAVMFDARQPEIRPDGCHLAPLPANLSVDRWRVARGGGDSLALRLRHHEQGPYAEHLPRSPGVRSIYALLDRARCEAVGVARMPGIARNLAAEMRDRLTRKGIDEGTLASQIPPDDAFLVVVRHAFGIPVDESLPGQALRSWQARCEEKAPGALNELAALLAKPSDFAARAARASARLAEILPIDEQQALSPRSADRGNEGELWAKMGESERQSSAESQQPAPDLPYGTDAPRAKTRRAPYHAYTIAHDREVEATELADAQQRAGLEAELTALTAPFRPLVTKLANRLQRRLLARQMRAWDFDLEEGLLDAAKLHRVVATPGTALSYKQEREGAFKDTVVSLLIDNSGSMRGRSIALAALSADVIGQALARCGVKTEILGFTTQDFRGGQSAKDWARAGKPTHPGRLNDLLHIVYKRADQSFRRVRDTLAIMLKPGLLKENVDGEALQWAADRLRRRPEERRILMVISDGAPNDQTTVKSNDPGYLDRHLRQVIAGLEAASDIQLVAIGIGHDVTGYYGRAVTVPDAERLGETMVAQLADLLDTDPSAGSATPH